ncbi:MAG: hypothetical protein K5756_01840 [Clostridiales bacterium]|nr:hypothetical protein [Clostridiales bacterium]
MKYASAIAVFICLVCTLCACGNGKKPNVSLPQTMTVLHESTTRSEEKILSNMWSIIPEYTGSGTVSTVSELNPADKHIMSAKYDFAKQDDILAYVFSLNLPDEWVPPQYKGDSYCIEHKYGESHSVRISYIPTEKENNFEITITMYKPVN